MDSATARAGKGVERELKFADVDHDALRARLLELEAELQGSSSFEDNWVFDRQGELVEARSLLRLRIDRQGCRITFKGPSSFEGKIKVRTELETGIGDFETAQAILEALGYRVIRRYQKFREEWLLGSILIALDHTPIGDFVEVEGEGCETVARRCGLDPATAELRNYLRLYEAHLASHPDSPPNMVFPGRG